MRWKLTAAIQIRLKAIERILRVFGVQLIIFLKNNQNLHEQEILQVSFAHDDLST